MTIPIMSSRRIAEMYPNVAPMVAGIKDWAPVVRYDTNTIAAGVIPQSIEFFNALPAFAVSNLEKQNEVPYRTIFLGFSFATFGTISDTLLVFENSELEIEKDNRTQPSWPVCAIPSGGGVNAEISTTVAAPLESATFGMDNAWRMLMQPFAIDQDQSFRVWQRTAPAITVVADTYVRVGLLGIEARRVI